MRFWRMSNDFSERCRSSTEQFVGGETYLKNHQSMGVRYLELELIRVVLSLSCRRACCVGSIHQKGTCETLSGPFSQVARDLEKFIAAMQHMTVRVAKIRLIRRWMCGDPSWVSRQPSPEATSRLYLAVTCGQLTVVDVASQWFCVKRQCVMGDRSTAPTFDDTTSMV